MDAPRLIESAEEELTSIIEKYHSKGVNYWRLLWIVLNLAVRLQARADAEYYLKLK